MIKKCKFCEINFNGKSRSKYCSMKCMGLDRTKTITGYKNCLVCNKRFPYRDTLKVRSYNGVSSVNSKYCSKICLDKSLIERNKNKIWTNEDRKHHAELAKVRFTGRQHTLEHREKASINNRGSKSHFWKGGITKGNQKDRATLKLKEWRRQVFIRDDFTCQGCYIKGGRLEAHHIKSWAKYPEFRYELSNGQTLCKECHKLTDNYKNKTNG